MVSSGKLVALLAALAGRVGVLPPPLTPAAVLLLLAAGAEALPSKRVQRTRSGDWATGMQLLGTHGLA